MAGRARVTDEIESNAIALALAGGNDANLRVIAQRLDCTVTLRGNQLIFEGKAEDVDKAQAALHELLTVVRSGRDVSPAMVESLMDIAVSNGGKPSEVYGDIVISHRGRQIGPRTTNQKVYVDAIRANTITLGIGPAGTGKTYLATAMAEQAHMSKAVGRIILTRPAVEAGERLGFLPGDMLAKVDPYLRPLYDALFDMLEPEVVSRLMERGTIEVAPLAYMRGRTLNDSFIILDEAQNTTAEQMKMFLTRLGFGSKIVVTGDVTQIDLPEGRGGSGLLAVRKILEGIDGLAFVDLGSRDVVRHRIVADIVDAYATHT